MGLDIDQEHSLKLNRKAYGITAVLLLLVAFLLTIATNLAIAVADSQQAQIQVSGLVKGPAPTQAAVINSPIANQHFINEIVTVSGTCPSNTFVEIYKNGVFAGTEVCSFGAFSLSIDLIPGSNELIAKVIDNIGQYGPESEPVLVFLDKVSNLNDQVSPEVDQPELFLDVAKLYQGGLPNQKIGIDMRVIGGVSPYAININWGDDKTDLALQPREGGLTQFHSYEQPGDYRINIKAKDSVGNEAVVQTIYVINGEFRVTAPSILNEPEKALPVLSVAWRAYILSVVSVLSFSLGQKRMIHLSKKKI